MIKVNVMDDSFNRAYWNAKRTLPVERLETPRQYGVRWREAFKCRIERGPGHQSYYVFDCDADYTWFMLKYA